MQGLAMPLSNPNRRDVLQIGCSSALGLGLSTTGQATPTTGRAKSVILVFLTGGASHIDTFDPKPQGGDARGEFDTIGTRIPGIRFTEHLPELAKRANQLAIVRSMAHRDNRHLSGTHNTLTGTIQPFRGNSNQDKELDRRDWPCYGGVVAKQRTSPADVPSQVTLPNPLIEGPLTWPGQHAGFLGSKHDPLVINSDPNAEDFRVAGLSLVDGLTISRIQHRQSLLTRLNRLNRSVEQSGPAIQVSEQRDSAYRLLTSTRLERALNIQSEPEKVRERYGRSTLGQTLLLARRLAEAEVPVVQCNMGIVQTWDTHTNNFPRLKDSLLPSLDSGLSALLDDLSERSLLDQTLVIAVGEFGRTPRISTLPTAKTVGRDHWAWCYTAVFAGADVFGGQVIGKSDRIGAYPLSAPYHPNDLGATVYRALGISPEQEVHDALGRPLRLNQGQPIEALSSGAG